MFPFNHLPLELQEKTIAFAMEYADRDPMFANKPRVTFLTNPVVAKDVHNLLAWVPSKLRDEAGEVTKSLTQEHPFLLKKRYFKNIESTDAIENAQKICDALKKQFSGYYMYDKRMNVSGAEINPEEYFEILAKRVPVLTEGATGQEILKAHYIAGIQLAHDILPLVKMIDFYDLEIACYIAACLKDYDRVEKLFEDPRWYVKKWETGYFVGRDGSRSEILYAENPNDFDFIQCAKYGNLNGLKKLETTNRSVAERALHDAVCRGYTDIVQLLLEKCTLLSDSVVKEAFEDALSYPHKDIVLLLEKHFAISSKDAIKGKMKAAMRNKDINMVETILKEKGSELLLEDTIELLSCPSALAYPEGFQALLAHKKSQIPDQVMEEGFIKLFIEDFDSLDNFWGLDNIVGCVKAVLKIVGSSLSKQTLEAAHTLFSEKEKTEMLNSLIEEIEKHIHMKHPAKARCA